MLQKPEDWLRDRAFSPNWLISNNSTTQNGAVILTRTQDGTEQYTAKPLNNTCNCQPEWKFNSFSDLQSRFDDLMDTWQKSAPLAAPIQQVRPGLGAIGVLLSLASTKYGNASFQLEHGLLRIIPEHSRKMLNGVLEGVLLENRELKEEVAVLKGAIAKLQNRESHGGLGDK